MMIHLHVTFWPTDLNVIISPTETSCRLYTPLVNVSPLCKYRPSWEAYVRLSGCDSRSFFILLHMFGNSCSLQLTQRRGSNDCSCGWMMVVARCAVKSVACWLCWKCCGWQRWRLLWGMLLMWNKLRMEELVWSPLKTISLHVCRF